MALPGTDLLSTSAYDVLISDVISGAHIGRGIIGGIECEHLAFRRNVTSKAMAAAPQYTVVIRDWKIGIEPNANDFVFTPPEGAKQFDVRALASFDELPLLKEVQK